MGDADARVGGYVSRESHEGWNAFADAHGVTVTALIEAAGIMLGRGMRGEVRLSPDIAESLSALAREITAQRRRRPGPRRRF